MVSLSALTALPWFCYKAVVTLHISVTLEDKLHAWNSSSATTTLRANTRSGTSRAPRAPSAAAALVIVMFRPHASSWSDRRAVTLALPWAATESARRSRHLSGSLASWLLQASVHRLLSGAFLQRTQGWKGAAWRPG